MINPLLEELDPARRPLLFLRNFGLLCLQEKDRAQCPNPATSESAISAHFAKQAETAPTIALSDCGYPAAYHDTTSAEPLWLSAVPR